MGRTKGRSWQHRQEGWSGVRLRNLHKAHSLTKDQFRRGAEKKLSGRKFFKSSRISSLDGSTFVPNFLSACLQTISAHVVPVGMRPDSDHFVKTVKSRRTSTYSIDPIPIAQILEDCGYFP